MDSKTAAHHGKREVRLEDDALVRGAGRFVDDARFDAMIAGGEFLEHATWVVCA